MCQGKEKGSQAQVQTISQKPKALSGTPGQEQDVVGCQRGHGGCMRHLSSHNAIRSPSSGDMQQLQLCAYMEMGWEFFGFLLHQLEDKWIERYTCLVNWLNNSVFGENVGFCTLVSDEAGLKDRNGMKNARMSRVNGGKELDKWAVPTGETENELLSETKWEVE